MEYPVINTYATGRKIRHLRRERNVRVTDVCKFLGGISEQAVYKWEQGKSIPSTDNLYALSHLFQVHMEELIVEEADKASYFFAGIVHTGPRLNYELLVKAVKGNYTVIEPREKEQMKRANAKSKR